MDSLTLSQFQSVLGNTIRMNRQLQNVWVQAEFSDLRVSGGHCYMELIEKDALGTTRAKMRAMIWSGTLAMIRRKFIEATGRDIASGMKVLVRGSATHHNLYGLSFSISDIDPSYTLGDMERVRREILERLAREGVIECNRRLPLPMAPQRIAVISSDGAAGYGDFMNQLESNPDGFAIYPFLFPAVMQGERTAPTVMEALDKVEMTGRMWDAVVITRGGGATTDLNGFDNYDLARRVATFPIPVIVGIGHERDRTVLDEIAAVRCKTPTAVAAWIIDTLRIAYTVAAERVQRIAAFGADAIRGEHIRLTHLSQSLPASARNIVMRHRLKLSQLSQSLPALVSGRVMRQHLRLNEYAARMQRDIEATRSASEATLSKIELRLGNAAATATGREQQRLQRLADMLRLLDPTNTLRRGYSITRINGHALTSISEATPGSILETTLPDGTITSRLLS